MDKIDNLINTLEKIYHLMSLVYKANYPAGIQLPQDELMTRQQVKDYLGISESTYRRKVKDGTIKPLKMPGGERCYKSQLLGQLQESRRRGRI
ncbi:helix-turn-helix transcriptional regulator [Pedobacter kyonggii]|uniref:DNA-binding protein n=1 Tax=Pedobacter kyonggii TaxID=1926871 RepID=A0A4Q9HCS5_9SPHI|nr:DNA-binding protein [Pedobacter kyonggii]TBO42232.1 DNA-binding protein [Pedobacter kyonggii]